MKEELVQIIVQRLEKDADTLREDFNRDKNLPTRFAAIDNLFPEDIARKLYEVFPPTEEMRLLDSFR
ncbi:MAG: 2OG-Fe(II) oxygenase, partial [Acidobacteria bacterium]|nr:2OG-Fe(II) oxygenase [Acidobacteriota bacterium]